MQYDFIIIGGGIVGIAYAWQLQRRRPRDKIPLLGTGKTDYAALQTIVNDRLNT